MPHPHRLHLQRLLDGHLQRRRHQPHPAPLALQTRLRPVLLRPLLQPQPGPGRCPVQRLGLLPRRRLLRRRVRV